MAGSEGGPDGGERGAEGPPRLDERHYQTLVNTVSQLVWTNRPDGTVAFLNQRWYDYTGGTPAEMLGMGWTRAVHPDDRAPILARREIAVRAGAPYEHEARFRRHDGAYRWHLAQVQPVRDADGRIVVWHGAATDIDDRRRIEEAQRLLAEASARLAASLDYAATLRTVAHLAVPRLADYCLIDVVGEDGNLHRLAVAHADPAKAALLDQTRANAPDRAGSSPLAQSFARGESVLVAEVTPEWVVRATREGEHRRQAEALGPRSLMLVPLVARGHALGLLTAVATDASGRRYDAEDLALAEELARRCALAIDNARLYEAERRARAAAEAAQDRVALLAAERAATLQRIVDGVIVTDPTGRITFVNEAARRLHGVAELDVPVEEYTATYHLLTLDGEPYPPQELPLARAVLRGETVVDAPWRIRRPDGTEIVAEGSATLIVGEDGARLGAVLTLRDVTAQRALERQKDESLAARDRALALAEAARRRLAFLAEASAALAASLDYGATLAAVARLAVPDLADWCAVDVIEADGTARRLAMEHVDPAKVALAAELHRRYPPDPDAPRGVAHVARTGRPELIAEVPDALLVASAVDAEHLRLLRALGPASSMIVPLTARGHGLGAITLAAAESGRRYGPDDLLFAEDLARRAATAVDNARLYAEAREAVRQREQFVSIASHELKTPLTAVQGYVDLLGRQLARPDLDHDRLGRYLDQLRAGAGRLNALVEDLLDASRMQQGRLDLRPVPCDLAALAREVLDRFAQAPEYTPAHTLALDAPEPIAGTWDCRRLDQVLTNLVSNALKYSPAGGEVSVGVRWERACDPPRALITVRDRGLGIAPADREGLFQPFARLAGGGAGIGGTGLGLYIVRQIVEGHGGTIDVASAPGAGSTFTIAIPPAVPASAQPAGEAGAPPTA